MNAKKLYEWIDSLISDIEFTYHGIGGSICPFTREDISVAYGEEYMDFSSVKEAMETPFIEGKPLQEICTELVFDITPQ